MRIVIRIFLLIAYSIGIYLVMVSLTSGAIAGCGGGLPCDKILKSEWASTVTGDTSIPQVFFNQKGRFGSITSESSFNMIMGLEFPIEIKRRR